jgi:phosphodiesterase/alkaline phosphatase D-like protein
MAWLARVASVGLVLVVPSVALAAAPTATTSAATMVMTSSAVLNGSGNPNGESTTGWFRVSTTNPVTCNDTFGTRVPATSGTGLGAGTVNTAYSITTTNLASGVTHYFCAITSNASGTAFGAVLSFTTPAAPTVVTTGATTITASSAALAGSANPTAATTTGWFRFSATNPGTCSDSFGTRVPASGGTALGSGTSTVNWSVNTNTVTTLQPGTTYYYCALASNSFGTSVGSIVSFTTPPVAPAVSTGSVTGLSASAATLNGSANPGGGSTTTWFRYTNVNPGGCSDTFGTRVPASGGSDLGAGNTSVAFSEAITGLTMGTTYYYCAIGTNPAGTSFGSLLSFVTPTTPAATTSAASSITNTTAQLNGTGDPNGAAATGWFRLSTTNPGACDDTFGTRVPSSGGSVLGTGTSAISYSQPVTGLTANTTYYACAIVANAIGTSFGAVVSFTTRDRPLVTTNPATTLTTSSAQLNGSANPNGATATGWFRFSATDPGACSDSFGTRVPSSGGAALGTGTTAVAYTHNTNLVTTLQPGTTYYFCAIASNTYGTSFGALTTFTTPAAAPSVSTGAATLVTASTATLNGSANPGGGGTTAWFRYNTANPGTCNDTFGTRVPAAGGTSLGAGNTSVAFSEPITGLSQGTTYYVCAIAQNSAGTSVGSVVSFVTPSAPGVTTSAATSITNVQAQLNGTGDPNGDAASGWFRLSTANPGTCNDTFGTRVPTTGSVILGSGTSAVAFNQPASGLSPNTTYYYCAIAQNALGTGVGTVGSFTTLDQPSVTTSGATSVASGSAQLNGSANPNGATSTGWFRFATTNPGTCSDMFGTRVPTSGGASLGAGRAALAYTYNTNVVTTLQPGTTYYYCAIASNAYGTSFGAPQTFTTPAVLPSVSTSSATLVTATTATINGAANPGGGSTTGWFRYTNVNPGSCSDTFGTRVPVSGGADLGAGNASVPFSQPLTGLTMGTTYYYCAIASNSLGTVFGSLLSFTTPTAPVVTTTAATGIGDTVAQLNATGDPNSDAATGWFRIHTADPGTCDDSFGTRVPATGGSSLGSGTSAVSFNQPVTGLLPNTTYYYCALASNSLGMSVGAVMSFSTRDRAAVTTLPATSLTTSSAQLNGSADPNGATTTGWFRFAATDPGTCTDSFGTRVPSSGGSNLGAGTAAVMYTLNTNTITTLLPGTTYYYCAIASNSFGTSFGAVVSFTTPAALPAVSTVSATLVTASTATLNGSANPRGGSTTAWFRYSSTFPGSCSDTFGTRVPAMGGTDLGAGNTSVAFAQPITGLTQGTTYYYCAIASNSAGTSFGSVSSFVTPTSPTATTAAATSITNTTAQLNGSGNPNRDAATGWFRYSATNPVTCDDSFGTRVPASSGTALGSGASAVSFSQPVSGLVPNTTYYYCAIVQNSLGTSSGSIVSFTTRDQPVVTTAAATSVTTVSAQLNGSANPNGQTASGWFRFSATNPGACSDTFGSRVPSSGGASLGAGTIAVNYTYNTNVVTTLQPGTTYYYCAIASNAYGTSFGSVLTFTTPAAVPSVATSAATAITATTATLNGSANPGGGATTAWFRYSATFPSTCNDTFGTRVPATGGTSLGSGNASVAFAEPLTGLSLGTTYYFCAIAQNSAGTSFGSVLSFVTLSAPGVTTNAASSVSNVQAQLNGSGDPNGDAATGWFRLSTTNPVTCDDSFGTRVPTVGSVTLGTGTSAVSYSQPASGLQPNTTYYYCAIASNSLGTSFGAVVSFTTLDQPVVTTTPATSVIAASAQLNGSANPNGATSTGWFRYATVNPVTCSDSFGTRVPASGGASLGAGRVAVAYSYNTNLTGALQPGTTYYYCAIASNTYGVSVGAVQTFTTSPMLPSVTTSSATDLTSTTATINGAATAGGAATTGWFRYTATNPGSCSDTFGTRVPATGGSDLGSAGTTSVAFSQGLTGLSPNTLYYYCAIASNSVGIAYGALLTFRAPATPTVTTLAATPVTAMTATLNGSANPNGNATTAWFRYNTASPGACNDSFGIRVPASAGTSLGSGLSAVSFAQALSALAPGTTYYFCAIAQNSQGTSVGQLLSFTTPVSDQAPGVMTIAASAVTGTTATLNGSANPTGAATTGWFRYATTSPGSCNDSFGTRVPGSGGTSLGSGNSPIAYSEPLTGLAPGTTYFFCAIAQNNAGTSVGSVLSFSTPVAPTAATLAASAVGAATATLNASSNPNGAETTGWFRYDTTTPGACDDSFGTRVPATGGAALGSGTAAVTFSQTVTGLQPNTTYYYCAIAQNGAGTAFGAVMSFVTPLAPTVTTLDASSVASTSAMINASANPNGGATNGWFRYATTSPGTCDDSFGTRAPASGGSALGSGSAAVQYTQALSGLAPSTTYYYCAIAGNAVGTAVGAVMSFTTTSAPTVATAAASAVTSMGATLNGASNPRMSAATGYFRYAATDPGTCNDSFGTRAPAAGGTALGAGGAEVAFSEIVTGLVPGTTYYACAIASNAEGTGFGAVVSFTTPATPIVTTSAPSGLSSTGATLSGAANPGRDATTGYFRYGTTNPGTCTDTFGTRAPASGGSALGAGAAAVAFSEAITGLVPGMTYYYCAVAQNSVGTGFGAVQSFVTTAPPAVTTLAASAITSTGATLNGQATPNGTAATGWFRYGTTDPGTCNDLYGTRVPATGGTALGSGTTAAAFSQPLTGLSPGTTYYFCAIAENGIGAVAGTALTFTTTALAPTVMTSSVSGIAGTMATLNGAANPNGAETTGWFRYASADPGSCTDSFGTRVPAATGGSALGAGTSSVSFSQVISGLSAGVTYYFCAVASNAAGTSFGAVLTFRVDAPAPTVATEAASGVAARTATLNGSANPNGSTATGWFRYDTTMPAACNDSFGTRTPATGGTNLGAGSTAVPFSAALTGLEPNQTYHYCAIASNMGGAAFGNVMSFTTQAAAPTVRTLPAGTATDGRKILSGAANPHGMTGTAWFQYGTTDPGTCAAGFGTRVPMPDITLGSGHVEVMLSATLGELPPGAYYYCAAATNSVGTSYGAVVRFDVVPTGTDGGAPDGGGSDGGGTDGGAGGTGGAAGTGGSGGGGGTAGTAGAGGGGGSAGSGAAGRGGSGGGQAGGRGGSPADGGVDGGRPPAGDDGCGCDLGAGSPGAGISILVLLAFGVLRRRRESARPCKFR